MKSIMNVKAAFCCFFSTTRPSSKIVVCLGSQCRGEYHLLLFLVLIFTFISFIFFLLYKFFKNHNKRVNTFLTVSAKEVTFAVGFFFCFFFCDLH